MSNEVKICSRCKIPKPLDDFYKRKDGYTRCYCKECDCELQKHYTKKSEVKQVIKEFNDKKQEIEMQNKQANKKSNKKLVFENGYYYWK